MVSRAAGKDDGLHIVRQEVRGQVGGFQAAAAADAQRRVEQRRVVEEHVFLALRRAVALRADHRHRRLDQPLGQLAGLAMVAEARMNCGSLP